MSGQTLADVLERALVAESALQERGFEVDEEWQYVTDLGGAWRVRLEAVAAARRDEPAGAAVTAAVDAVVEEASLIDDPHRAIDWLSTLPQVVLAALGEST